MQVHIYIYIFSSFHYYAKSLLLCNSLLCAVNIWVNSVDAILKLPLLSSSVSSVQFSCSVMSDSLWPQGLERARPPYALPTLRAFLDSCPSSQWCHPTISSSVIHVSSCLQSFPASESFPVSQFFSSGGQSIGISASASVLPVTIHDWFPSNTNIVLMFSCRILNDWTITIILTSYTSGITRFSLFTVLVPFTSIFVKEMEMVTKPL